MKLPWQTTQALPSPEPVEQKHLTSKAAYNAWLTAQGAEALFTVTVPPEMQQGPGSGGGYIAPRISRNEALQVPAVLRARNIIAGTLATLPVHYFNANREKQESSFLSQIDLDTTNVTVLAQTYEDLVFESVSWWRITQFDFSGRPLHATHVPFESVFVAAGAGLPSTQITTADIRFPTNGRVYIDGLLIPDAELIMFTSPNPPVLKHAARAIRACLQLDQAAARYANEPVPLGYFTPKEGQPDLEDDAAVDELLATWSAKRRQHAWAYIDGGLDAKSLSFDAEQIQLAEQRQHAVLEIARAFGVDPEDLGVSTTSRTYQNGEQRRQDLIDFTLAPYMRTVEQRLSMNDVSPRGTYALTNVDAFLRNDTKARMDAYKVGLEVGAYTVDEIRQLENRPTLTPAQKAELQPKPAPLPAAPVPEEVTNG